MQRRIKTWILQFIPLNKKVLFRIFSTFCMLQKFWRGYNIMKRHTVYLLKSSGKKLHYIKWKIKCVSSYKSIHMPSKCIICNYFALKVISLNADERLSSMFKQSRIFSFGSLFQLHMYYSGSEYFLLNKPKTIFLTLSYIHLQTFMWYEVYLCDISHCVYL